MVCISRVAGVLVGLAGVVQGAAYDAGGFEAPRFTSGLALEGQDPLGPWLRTGGTAGSATVQDLVVRSGAQAVRVERTGEDVFWGVNVPNAGVPGFIGIVWDLYVTPMIHLGNFGPFFGVQAYDELGNAPLLAGSAGMDAKTGEFLYQAEGTGFLVAGPVLAFNTWHRFEMVLDYTADEYSVFVNGALLVNREGFVDDGVLGEIDDFTDASLIAVAAAGDPGSIAAGGVAYFDNYAVIPEPACLAPVAILLMTARRRRCSVAQVTV